MRVKSKRLERKIEAFLKKYDFAKYEVDPDGELTIFDAKGEPFGLTEFVSGSPIKSEWKKLQKEVGKDLKEELKGERNV